MSDELCQPPIFFYLQHGGLINRYYAIYHEQNFMTRWPVLRILLTLLLYDTLRSCSAMGIYGHTLTVVCFFIYVFPRYGFRFGRTSMAWTRSMYLVADVISYARCLILYSEAQVDGIDGIDGTGLGWQGKGRENVRTGGVVLLLLYVSLD